MSWCIWFIKFKKDEVYLIKDKKITGFSDIEELISQKKNKVPFLTELELRKRDAKYMKKRFFKSYAVMDDRIITGQNPFCAKEVATLLINELKNQ